MVDGRSSYWAGGTPPADGDAPGVTHVVRLAARPMDGERLDWFPPNDFAELIDILGPGSCFKGGRWKLTSGRHDACNQAATRDVFETIVSCLSRKNPVPLKW